MNRSHLPDTPAEDDGQADSSRRAFFKQAGALSLAAMSGLALTRPAAAMPRAARPLPNDGLASGIVFHDANRSGRARGQAGIPGVLVSNGVDVASTDERGRYELPVQDGSAVFVIKPRGYRTRIDSLNLPRFYYLHHPTGTPDDGFLYRGIEPTGSLPESIDFPLYENREPDEFDVLVTADPQPYNLPHLQWYARETIPEFKRLPVAFGIVLGDVVGDHLDLYDPYNRINALAGFPWYHAFGNHDMNFMAADDRHASSTFQRVFGPTDYAFTHGQVHFIVLNNVFWEGFTRMRADGWPRRGQYRGHLRPTQLRFVKNLVERIPAEDRIVVCTHIPMINRGDSDGKHATPEFPELLAILSGHPHTLSLSGHTHVNLNYLLGEQMGYRAPGGALHHHFNVTAPCGSWYRGPLDHEGIPYSPGRDGSPKGYAVLRFRGGSDYHIRFKALRQSEDYQMQVYLPELVRRDALDSTQVHVNLFAGSTRSRVRMRIDSGEWIRLEQGEHHDPAYLALQARSQAHPDAGEGELPNPMLTDHHWRAKLPGHLAVGWHAVEVEATGHFGDIWRERRTFTVVTDPADVEHLNQGTRTPRG